MGCTHIPMGKDSFYIHILFDWPSLPKLGRPGPLITFFCQASANLASSDLLLRECFLHHALILQMLSRNLHTAPSTCGVSSGCLARARGPSQAVAVAPSYGRQLPVLVHLEFIRLISSCCCRQCKLRYTVTLLLLSVPVCDEEAGARDSK